MTQRPSVTACCGSSFLRGVKQTFCWKSMRSSKLGGGRPALALHDQLLFEDLSDIVKLGADKGFRDW